MNSTLETTRETQIKIMNVFRSLFDYHYSDENKVRKLIELVDDANEAMFLTTMVNQQLLAYLVATYFDGEIIIDHEIPDDLSKWVFHLDYRQLEDGNLHVFAYKEPIK